MRCRLRVLERLWHKRPQHQHEIQPARIGKRTRFRLRPARLGDNGHRNAWRKRAAIARCHKPVSNFQRLAGREEPKGNVLFIQPRCNGGAVALLHAHRNAAGQVRQQQYPRRGIAHVDHLPHEAIGIAHRLPLRYAVARAAQNDRAAHIGTARRADNTRRTHHVLLRLNDAEQQLQTAVLRHEGAVVAFNFLQPNGIRFQCLVAGMNEEIALHFARGRLHPLERRAHG